MKKEVLAVFIAFYSLVASAHSIGFSFENSLFNDVSGEHTSDLHIRKDNVYEFFHNTLIHQITMWGTRDNPYCEGLADSEIMEDVYVYYAAVIDAYLKERLIFTKEPEVLNDLDRIAVTVIHQHDVIHNQTSGGRTCVRSPEDDMEKEHLIFISHHSYLLAKMVVDNR